MDVKFTQSKKNILAVIIIATLFTVLYCKNKSYFKLNNSWQLRIIGIEHIGEDLKDGLRDTLVESVPWWDDSTLYQCSLYVNQFQNSSNVVWFEGLHNFTNDTSGSHCGIRATERGTKQKVISFVLFGDNHLYWDGLLDILNDASSLYPDYIVRLHTDPRGKYNVLCPNLMTHGHHFDICDVANLPPPLGSILNLKNKMLWRVAVFGDPLVERFLVRDSDGKLSAREAVAVADWVKSDKILHMMRDHPFHTTVILGGMYGIYQKDENTTNIMERVRRKILTKNFILGNDQFVLGRSIPRNIFLYHSLQHDSYNCKKFPNSLPFPTRRNGSNFVGNTLYRFGSSTSKNVCPVECRPREHLDWTYC